MKFMMFKQVLPSTFSKICGRHCLKQKYRNVLRKRFHALLHFSSLLLRFTVCNF